MFFLVGIAYIDFFLYFCRRNRVLESDSGAEKG